MAEEQTDISILQNIRNEIEKRIDVLTDDVKTLRNISEEKQQDLKQQISSVYQIIEEKLSQIQSIDLNLKDSNQNINDLNARTSSMSDNISSLLQSQNEIKRNIQSLSVDINKIQNDSVNQFNQLNEYTREISKKIAESAKRQERQTREEMVRGPRAAAQASLGITPSAEAKSLQQPEPTQKPESEEKKPKTWAKWFEENAGLLGAAAGAAAGVGAGALIGSGPKSAPSGPGYSSSPGEVPSAPPAPNIVGPGVAPGSAPSGPGYSNPPGEVPSDGMSQTLAAQRAARGANNLSDAQKRHMYALAVAEMGPPEVLRKKGIDPKEAYAAFMETPYNRGMTEGRENTNIGINLKKDYYQPLRAGEGKWYNKAYGQLGNTDSELYNLLNSSHQMVAAGSNFSNMGTQNASAGVAASARRTQTVTTEKYGETISRKDRAEFSRTHGAGTIRNTKKWIERTQRQSREIDEKSRTQTPSQPSSQAAPQPDASRVPPQSQQSQQPDARREDETVPSMAVKQMQGKKAGHRKNPLDEDLVTKLNYAANKTGVEIEVFSGSQTGPGASRPPGASHEHNDGKAADFELYITDKDGKRRLLNYDNPEDAVIIDKFTEEAGRAGVRSAGVDYMGKTKERRSSRFHMGTSRINPDAYLGRGRFKRSWSRGYRDFSKHGAPKDLKNYSTEAIRRLKEQQEQQKQPEQEQFAGDTPESRIAKAIEEEKRKVRREGLTDTQRRMKDIKEGRFNFATERRPDQQQGYKEEQSSSILSYLGINPAYGDDTKLSKEEVEKRNREFAEEQYQKSLQQFESSLGKDSLGDDTGTVYDPTSSEIPKYLKNMRRAMGMSEDDLEGKFLPNIERKPLSLESKKPVDKSKIDMSDMPGSLDDGGEEGPRTDNRWNPLSPVTYGKSEEKIREMIELAKKAAEAAETAAKTSTGNSGKGTTASGENNPQPPPATQPPTPPGGNQNGNQNPRKRTDNGLHSRARPSSNDYHPPAMNEAP